MYTNIHNQVQQLNKKGMGIRSIADQLGITKYQVYKALSEISPEKYQGPSFPGGQRKIKTPRKNIKRDITKLLKEGLGVRAISKTLGITQYAARNEIAQVREADKTIPIAKHRSQAEVKELVIDLGYDYYSIGKETKQTPKAVDTSVRRSHGQYTPMQDWVKKAAQSGISFSELKKSLKGISEKRAKEIIQENFPDCFIVETKLAGDTHFTPVTDSSKKHEWLNIDTSKKQFRYHVNDDQNYMSIKFDDELPGKQIKIFDITDIHIGSKAFRSDLLQRIISTIEKDPMAFFVIGGDLIEAITKASVADPNEQYESLNEQAVEAVKTFMPIAHKCLAIETGNHDSGRTEKTAQFDLARLMAQMLKVPYFRVRVIIDLNFRGVDKRISLAHNYGKALKLPQVVAAVHKIYSEILYPVHCWFSGHNHCSFVVPGEVTMLVPGKGFEQIRYYVANGGSFIKYTGTYAEQAGYARSTQDIVYFTFDDENNHTAGSIPVLSI